MKIENLKLQIGENVQTLPWVRCATSGFEMKSLSG